MCDHEHAREGAGSDLLHLEEARARDKTVVPQSTNERCVSRLEFQASGRGECDQLARKIDERSIATIWPRRDYEVAAWPENDAAAFKDLGQRRGERGAVTRLA